MGSYSSTASRPGPRSRRGGQPVTLPPPAVPEVRPLPLPDERDTTQREVLPGVVHVPG